MPLMVNCNGCPTQSDSRVIAESPLARAYVARQVWRDIYCSDKGLARGTIFAELDLPFMGGACCDM